MELNRLLGCCAVLGALTLPFSAAAAPVTPSYDTFGTLTGATFGGSGIPNNAVAITTFASNNNGGTITLGLTAHQRFSNPALTNDGNGTFYADPGRNGGNPASPGTGTQGSLWNFAWYIGGDSRNNYNFKLIYDVDSGSGTDESQLDSFNPNAKFLFYSIYGGMQGSQNLDFSLFGNAFDPLATGEYSFALIASNKNGGQEAARVAINVVVGQAPSQVPTPASAALFGIGLLGLGFAQRLRSRRSDDLR